jgi:transcriptional regulator with XRE-family HTH domain
MNKTEIGIKIKELRLQNGVSTYQLRQQGWCNTGLANIEKAGSNYTIDSLLKLCEQIGAEVIIQQKSYLTKQ